MNWLFKLHAKHILRQDKHGNLYQKHTNMSKGFMTAKSTPKHTIIVSIRKACFHRRCSFCRAITEVWRSIWLWIGGVGEETDTNRHRHERDVGLIESIIEPRVQGKDLFSISKRTETRDATENGEHKGVFSNRISMSLYYIF